jgi:hypothetical protein
MASHYYIIKIYINFDTWKALLIYSVPDLLFTREEGVSPPVVEFSDNSGCISLISSPVGLTFLWLISLNQNGSGQLLIFLT